MPPQQKDVRRKAKTILTEGESQMQDPQTKQKIEKCKWKRNLCEEDMDLYVLQTVNQRGGNGDRKP